MSDHTPAEIIEHDSLVVSPISQLPEIVANFGAVEARLTSILQDFEDVTVTVEYLPMARKNRAYLNSLSKELNEQRKAVKRAWMRPFDVFEAEVKRLDALISKCSGPLDTQIKDLEEQEREAKRAELMAHWHGYVVSDAVPYERIEDPKWLNRGTNARAAMEDMAHIAETIVAGIESLDSLKLEFDVDAKAAFYETLDVGRAVARNNELVERKRATEEIERQRAEYEAARVAAEQEAPRQDAEVVPLPQTPCPELDHAPGDPVAEVVPPRGRPVPVHTPPPQAWCFHVTCSVEQRDRIATYISGLGLSGRMTREEA